MTFRSRFYSLPVSLPVVAAVLCVAILAATAINTRAEEPAADVSAAQWLEQMAASFRNRNYDGVLVSNRGGKMRSVRVVHVVRDGMESERIEYLDGESIEVQRDNHPVDCIHTGKQLISAAAYGGLFNSLSAATSGGAMNIGASSSDRPAGASGAPGSVVYSLDLMPDSRVAGRPVVVIGVQPADEHRYSHRLFLDKASQLLLKSQVLDKQANVLESFQFTQISVDDEVQIESLASDADQSVHEAFHSLPMGVESQPVGWDLSWLPAGFVAASQRSGSAGKLSVLGEGIESMHFTDGFALFSVFLQAREKEVEAFETRVGSTLAYMTPKKMRDGWASVTVVGELPLATAVKIAQSLEEDSFAEAPEPSQ